MVVGDGRPQCGHTRRLLASAGRPTPSSDLSQLRLEQPAVGAGVPSHAGHDQPAEQLVAVVVGHECKQYLAIAPVYSGLATPRLDV